jgi:hypothetical protein
MPPAGALLNYIFAKLGFFAGFSLHIINFAVRISKAAMGEEHLLI